MEAIFELRFPASEKWGMRSVVKFANVAESEGFPEVVDSAEGFQINFGPTGSKPEFRPVSRRIQTWNEQKTELWQASAELFAANRRSPYNGWNEFRPHIQKGYGLYQKIAKQKKANQMVLHYVNRIEFDENHPVEDLLVFAPPNVPFAKTVNSLSTTAQYTFADGDSITVTAGLNLEAKPVMMLLLIYASPSPPLREIELWKRLDKAHNRLVEAFEKSISDKLRDRMVRL